MAFLLNRLSTGNSRIIEHTKNDNYWADGGDGSGRNMLGNILMKVRAELTVHTQIPNPQNYLKKDSL